MTSWEERAYEKGYSYFVTCEILLKKHGLQIDLWKKMMDLEIVEKFIADDMLFVLKL